jgi:hypothetical protein
VDLTAHPLAPCCATQRHCDCPSPGRRNPTALVGGRQVALAFAVETRTLLPAGDLLNTLTPILAIASALCFLLAAAALLRWVVPGAWFGWLIVAGAVLSIVLQVVWLSGWAVLPLLVDVALLWVVFGQHVTVASLRG